MKHAILAVVLLAAAGCASVHLVKPGATAEEFEQDKATCAAQALGGPSNIFLQREILLLCLRGRGWVPEGAAVTEQEERPAIYSPELVP